MTNVYLISLIIAGASLSGLFLGRRSENILSKYSSPILGVSVGILLVTIAHLGFEAFEESEIVWLTGLAIVIGIAFAEILHRTSHETHCHHDHSEHTDEHATKADIAAQKSDHPEHYDHPIAVLRKPMLGKIIIGDSIHNLIDGFTLAAVSVSFPLATIPLAFSMFLHEVIQEVAEFFILKEAGISKRKIIFFNALSSLSIVLGVFLGLSLSFVHQIVPYLAGFSCGILAHFMFYDGFYLVFKSHESKSGIDSTGSVDISSERNAAHQQRVAFKILYIAIGSIVGYILLQTLATHI